MLLVGLDNAKTHHLDQPRKTVPKLYHLSEKGLLAKGKGKSFLKS